jgi:NitT/TauT family transport system substrate-binding protein
MLSKRHVIGLFAGLVLSATGAVAQEKTKIKFTLDWKYQGIHAFVFWAADKGYFAADGLDVEIDQGTGSAATVTRIVSGTYDAGLGDVNAIIQYAGTKPGEQLKMVYMLYNTPPFAVIVKKDSPIKTLKDMEGKSLGSPAGGATGQLFPALAKLNGVDPAKVSITSMAPNLQEQMLMHGQVDSSGIFTVTSYINLIGMKVDPEKDIRWFYFSDYGIDLYSNGVMVSTKFLAEKPKAIAGMMKIEPLMNAALEKQRLVYAFKQHFVSKETDEIGMGDIKDDRMDRSIKLLVETYNLPNTPKVSDIFDRSAMPPKSDRILKLAK